MERYVGPNFSQQGLTLSEEEILGNSRILSILGILMYDRQFSIPFLEKTTEWYDSWICLRTQKGLTPQFCFRYLFDNGTDSADNWTDFNDIVRYFGATWPRDEIEKAFDDEIHRRYFAALEHGNCDKNANHDEADTRHS